MTEEEYLEAFSLARKHPWLNGDDDLALGLQSLIFDCKAANHPWLPRTMLEKFKVITSSEMSEITKLIAEQIEYCFSPSDTLISAVSDDSKPDGSEIIINALKGKLGANWKNSLNNHFPNALLADKNEIKNYILVDDFIGTGNKIHEIMECLERHLNKYGITEYTITIAAFASMREGENLINKFHPGTTIISGHTMEKAISNGFTEPLRSKVRDAMMELEETFLHNSSRWKKGIIPKDPRYYNFGYQQSEALVWIEGFNIPNNVFPLFWFDKKFSPEDKKKRIPRRTLFSRK